MAVPARGWGGRGAGGGGPAAVLGVLELELDEAALAGGVARVSTLEAVLPDGLPLRFDAGDGAELSCDVTAAAAEAPGRTVTVYLALPPLWRAGRLDTMTGRYRSENSEAVPDLSSGENPASLTLWRPDIRLVTEAERADMICLPLLRIAQQGGGFARRAYAPPSPRVLPDSPLGRKVATLCAKAREKCVFLSGRLRQAKDAGKDDDIDEIRRQLAALWARRRKWKPRWALAWPIPPPCSACWPAWPAR